MNVAQLRLAAQRITGPHLDSPVAVVRHLLGLQGQDWSGAKWAIGVRAPDVTLADVDAAFAAGAIVRSWPLRGTLHVVAAEDLGWLVELTAPGVLAGAARRRAELGLDDKLLAKARAIAERELAGRRLSRDALVAAWNRGKLAIDWHRAYHALFFLSLHGVICECSEDEIALAAEWIRAPRRPVRDEALGELCRRYFTSHGPATLADLARWAKLPLRDLKIGMAVAGPALVERGGLIAAPELFAAELAAKRCVLLPGFDELVLGYADRTATLDKAHEPRIVPGGNGVFKATIVAGGRVVGTWKRTQRAKEIVVEPALWAKTAPSGLDRAIAAYGRFIGMPARLAPARR